MEDTTLDNAHIILVNTTQQHSLIYSSCTDKLIAPSYLAIYIQYNE